MQFQFGVGTVIGKRTDLANQPTMFFGVTEAWDVDFSQELVTLLGQFKVAVDAAPGEQKITGKIKFARLQASTIGNGLLGIAPTLNAGFSITGPEVRTAIPATTFTVTGGANYSSDLGILYHNTGVPLLPTTATPTAGFYIAGIAGTGTYTINAADQAVVGGLDVFYLQAETTLQNIDLNQQLMGTGPVIEIDAYVPYSVLGVTKKFSMQLYACRLGKFPFNFKNKAYMVPEVSFTAFARADGAIGRWALTE